MRREARAVLFDLDDTLYPLRRFVMSGFAACAEYLEAGWSIDRRDALKVLVGASHGPTRGRELQVCAARFGLGESVVSTMVLVIRNHQPSIRLPQASRHTLAALKPGWRVGIVTNGLPDLQARKIRALGLALHVDAIVYAHDCGPGLGKPHREPFLEAAARLGVAVDRTVFVGDDVQTDVMGARGVGMRTVHYARSAAERSAARAVSADATVSSLEDVPRIAGALVPEQWSSHVA